METDDNKTSLVWSAVATWSEMLAASRHSNNTLASYRSDVIIALKQLGANENSTLTWFANLNKSEITNWLLQMRSSNKASTINRKMCAVKNFAEFLRKNYKLNVSIFSTNKLSKAGVQKLPRTIDSGLIFEFLKKLEENLSDSWQNLQIYLIVNIIYGLGLRISEAISISFEDFSDQGILIHGKGKRERIIPIPESLASLLKLHIKTCPFLVQNPKPSGLFFDKNGNRAERRAISYEITKLFSLLCGHKTSPHKFRHSCASHLLSNGANIREIQELLGHENLSSTQIYTHVSKNVIANEYYKAHPAITKQ